MQNEPGNYSHSSHTGGSGKADPCKGGTSPRGAYTYFVKRSKYGFHSNVFVSHAYDKEVT